MKRTFHELFCEKVKKDADLHRLLFRMEAVDEHGTITPEEWEAASISSFPPFFLNSSVLVNSWCL